MNNNQLDLRIKQLQDEITANAREVVRLHAVIVNEETQLLSLFAQRDDESGLKVRVMNHEVQTSASYHGDNQ